MGNYDATFNTICRVCLQHDDAQNMVSLTNSSGDKGLSFHGESLQKVTKVPVKKNEYFPTKICKVCTKSLEELTAFMLQLETSDKKLSELIALSLKQDFTGDMVKEVICQYTLFCQYFPEEAKLTDCPGTSCIVQSLTEEQQAKLEDGSYLNIEVEVKVQELQDQNDSDNDMSDLMNSRENISESDSDSVDRFLDSIESLVTTKIKQEKVQTKTKRHTKEFKRKASKNLTCPICHRTLANSATYDCHMQRHHGVCRYICDQCGKGYPRKAEMIQHQVNRHSIGPCLKCDHCPFKTGIRIELIEHMRLHTGERPFTCEKCGLNFRRKAIHRRHLKRHNEKTVSCDHCPHKFYQRDDMLAHCNNVHERKYLFVCQVCKLTYSHAGSVRKHMSVKHNIPREKQGKIVRINKNRNGSLFKEAKSIETSHKESEEFY